MKLPFRIRSADRDKDTDLERFGELRKQLERLAGECERESEGLNRRYAAAKHHASIALQLLEAEGDREDLDPNLAEAERTLLQCERRLAELQVHSRFFLTLRDQVATKLNEIGNA